MPQQPLPRSLSEARLRAVMERLILTGVVDRSVDPRAAVARLLRSRAALARVAPAERARPAS